MEIKLYNLRKEKYPDENYILKDLSKITIDLGNEDNLKNLPFCPINNSFINFNKSNKQNHLLCSLLYGN